MPWSASLPLSRWGAIEIPQAMGFGAWVATTPQPARPITHTIPRPGSSGNQALEDVTQPRRPDLFSILWTIRKVETRWCALFGVEVALLARALQDPHNQRLAPLV